MELTQSPVFLLGSVISKLEVHLRQSLESRSLAVVGAHAGSVSGTEG